MNEIDLNNIDLSSILPSTTLTFSEEESQENKKVAEIHTLAQLNVLLDEYEKRQKFSGMDKWFKPGTPFGIDKLPKHKAFFDAGKDYGQRLLMGGNRSSKTVSGALEAAFHATGLYPEWWEGKRFDEPTHGWAVGSTARATRDTVQKELMGPVGAWGTGMIPSERIGKIWTRSGASIPPTPTTC